MDHSHQAPPLRVIVVPIISDDEHRILICKTPPDRGVFPGKWGLPGGGIEPGELMEQALRREVREELGLEIENIKPLHFKEAVEAKQFPHERLEPVHMIYLMFRCRASSKNVALNEEFVEFAWILPSDLARFDLNEETARTFSELGITLDGPA